jgi:hypothetical protein
MFKQIKLNKKALNKDFKDSFLSLNSTTTTTIYLKETLYDSNTKALVICPNITQALLKDIFVSYYSFIDYLLNNGLIKNNLEIDLIFLYSEGALSYNYNINSNKVKKFCLKLSKLIKDIKEHTNINSVILFSVEQMVDNIYPSNCGYLINSQILYYPKKIFTYYDNFKLFLSINENDLDTSVKFKEKKLMWELYSNSFTGGFPELELSKINIEYRICADIELKITNSKNKILLVSANELHLSNIFKNNKSLKNIMQILINDSFFSSYSYESKKALSNDSFNNFYSIALLLNLNGIKYKLFFVD